MIWFTSDLHLFHKNCLTLGKGRPFASVEQMNEEIIKRWNKKVGVNDTVYILGDICWGKNSNIINEIFGKKLNGIKYLILGNHDKPSNLERANCFVKITPYEEIMIDDDHIVLCHYPIADWARAYHGSYHLYGHCHGNFDLATITKDLGHHNTKCMDVGVDTHNFEPWSWKEIKEKLG